MERLYFKYRFYTETHNSNRYSPSFQYNFMFEDKLDYVKMFDKVVPEDFYLTPKRF
jgi:hypothetical protein